MPVDGLWGAGRSVNSDFITGLRWRNRRQANAPRGSTGPPPLRQGFGGEACEPEREVRASGDFPPGRRNLSSPWRTAACAGPESGTPAGVRVGWGQVLKPTREASSCSVATACLDIRCCRYSERDSLMLAGTIRGEVDDGVHARISLYREHEIPSGCRCDGVGRGSLQAAGPPAGSAVNLHRDHQAAGRGPGRRSEHRDQLPAAPSACGDSCRCGGEV